MQKLADKYASHRLIAEALKNKGYKIKHHKTKAAIVSLVSPQGVTWGNSEGAIVYPFNSKSIVEIAHDKILTYKVARAANFSTPYTLAVTDEISDSQLQDVLNTYKEVVVKPADRALSIGLTLHVQSLVALKRAIEYAKEFSASVLIQQQVTGEEIRFTILEGKVIAALLRRTARVIGDGVSLVTELIKQENKERERLQFEYLSYPQLTDSLIDSQFFINDEVPARGSVVELSHSTMIKGGCSVYDILSDIHHTYVSAVERFANKLGAGFVVVDVFCSAYGEPATPANHWLIELNTAPVLKMYYACRGGQQFDIVSHLIDMIDCRLHGKTLDGKSQL